MTAIDLPAYFDGGYERNGKIMRCCPVHGDKSPSLSLKLGDNGAWLVHCFAGCPVADVLAAVGLEVTDLFPDKPQRGNGQSKHRLSHRDALLLLRREAFVVAIAAQIVRDSDVLDGDDADRITIAARRITEVCEVAGVRDE